jgi:CRISPR/Cas system CSM-associated protein Csm3 (group 7 of RAMP superfamily)
VARDVYSRLRLTGTLVTWSPLHVGGHGDDVDSDLPLARDGAGQVYVPGTSLAGSLRELAERLLGENLIDSLWGYQRDDRGHASFVVIDDAVIENADLVVIEIRDGVGIDRQWSAAAEHIKYDCAILPRGTRMKLHVTVDVTKRDGRNEALAMIAALKEALEQGEVGLGAARTRGLGHVRLIDGTLTEQVFGTRQGILGLLRQSAGAVVSSGDLAQASAAHRPQPRPRLKLTIHWKPDGPLMVKAGFDGIAADMLPLTSGIDGQVSLVLPGSSVKGAFRSQAERIVRTVLLDSRPAWLGEQDAKKKFLDAVEVKLINELFGERGEKADAHDNRTWLPGLGAVAVIDCYGQRRLTQQQWQAIQAATNDQELRQALDAAGLKPWTQAYHVAIDRWLGSAAESMLYAVLEPHRTEWEPLTLEVDLRRLPDALHLPGMALLLLVIRDLAQGRLPLGFATHRGMGAVCVERVEVTGRDLPKDLQALSNVNLSSGRLVDLPASLRQALNQAWQQWIEHNRLEVRA